jgi:hypothetical protein
MKSCLGFRICFAALLLAQPALADVETCTTPAGGISCTGTLSIPEHVFLETFTLAGSSTITVQTYGFGGGTNAAGTVSSPGGFDPLVALFSGVATDATVLLDGGGNPIASADTLFGLFSSGCPPAGTVMVGTVPGNCGDDGLTVSLAAGVYTLLLSDANFLPLAVDPGILSPFDLTDTTSNNYGSSTGNGAYTDLTGGAFETCVTLMDCNMDTGNFAVDILASSGPPLSPVPEPGSLALLCSVLAVLIGRAVGARDSGTSARLLPRSTARLPRGSACGNGSSVGSATASEPI